MVVITKGLLGDCVSVHKVTTRAGAQAKPFPNLNNALSQARTKEGFTPLHLAAARGRAAAVQALLTSVGDKLASTLLQQADRRGRVAAELAARAGHQVGCKEGG